MTSEFIYAKHNPIRSNSVKKSAMQRQSAKETRKNLPIIPSAILQRKFQNCPANANGALVLLPYWANVRFHQVATLRALVAVYDNIPVNDLNYVHHLFLLYQIRNALNPIANQLNGNPHFNVLNPFIMWLNTEFNAVLMQMFPNYGRLPRHGPGNGGSGNGGGSKLMRVGASLDLAADYPECFPEEQ